MRRVLAVAAMGFLVAAGAAVAQEHWTEGPVWTVSFYRTEPGKFDEYMKWLRSHSLVTAAEQKKQGLILDTKVFVKAPSSPEDWDVAVATLYLSFAKAMDFNQGDDEKAKAIASKHWKTADLDKQRDSSAPRFSLRRYIGTDIVREVSLKPMP